MKTIEARYLYLAFFVMPINLFTYGTLMIPQIWEAVVRHPYISGEARLMDYQRFVVRGEVYPGLSYQPTCSVHGILYYDVRTDDLARLDAFEGECYERSQVQVTIGNNKEVTAETYLVRKQYLGMLTNEVWTIQGFKRKDLFRFLDSYPGWSG